MAKPTIFLSWSKLSGHQLALALGELIEDIISSAEPFISSEDIESGEAWDAVIDGKLKAAAFGVICVTADNIASPWLNYEAGSLATRLGGQTAPYLLGLEPDDLGSFPFSRLQASRADRDGTLKLLEAINLKVGNDYTIPTDRLRRLFAKGWTEYQPRIAAIKVGATPPQREPSETQEEMFAAIRALERQVHATHQAIETLAADRFNGKANLLQTLQEDALRASSAVSRLSEVEQARFYGPPAIGAIGITGPTWRPSKKKTKGEP